MKNEKLCSYLLVKILILIYNQVAVNKHKARHVESMTKTWNVSRIHQPKKYMTVLCVLDYGKSNAVKKETIFFESTWSIEEEA